MTHFDGSRLSQQRGHEAGGVILSRTSRGLTCQVRVRTLTEFLMGKPGRTTKGFVLFQKKQPPEAQGV